jgi:ferric-dicitrate binding protein FerR (iron transport regulator)
MAGENEISENRGVRHASSTVSRRAAAMSEQRKDPRFTRRPLLFGLPALLALSAHSDALAESPPPAGRVDEVRGTATAEVAQDKRILSAAASVFVGESVLTAEQSRIALRLGRDTTLRLGEKARIKIDRFLVAAGGEITLEQGPLLLDKAPNSGARPVQVRGPFGLITVRGTKIFAGPSQGVFGIVVVQGAVVVAAAGQSVTLRSGEGTDIRSPGAAPTPPRRWGPPRVEAALASVD